MERTTALLLTVGLMVGCHGPAGWQAQQIELTPEAEALAGAAAAPTLEARYGGVLADPEAEERMQRVGRVLCARTCALEGEYQFQILGSDTVNALSLPGGRIYLTRGLYARIKTDAQLAAIIAHEMAHLVAKDHFKPRCGDPEAALDREVCADLRAVCYLKAAGYAPLSMCEVIEIIRDQQPDGWSDIRATAAAAKSDQLTHRPEPV